VSDQKVVVIGAGPAGLAVAQELSRAGVPSVVLERADSIGSSWRARYDRLRLNTCRLTSTLPRSRYAKGTGLFPSRDEMVRYLEDYAEQHNLDVRLGVRVDRIDRGDGDWRLQSSAGAQTARQVVVATGYEHTPSIPAWPGRERFQGRLLHAAEYRNPEPFRGDEALVVGPGCSGMEIAFDLVEGGVRLVNVAVRTQPNIMLRQSGTMPGDLPAIAMLSLPPRIADVPARLVRRLSIGNLRDYGLVPPTEGVFSRQRREGKAPAIVDKEMIRAIKQRRIGIVAGVRSLGERGVMITDDTTLQPDAVYRRNRVQPWPGATRGPSRRARRGESSSGARWAGGRSGAAVRRLHAAARTDRLHGP